MINVAATVKLRMLQNISLNNDRVGGHGKMATLSQGDCTDSTNIANQAATGNQWCFDREQ